MDLSEIPLEVLENILSHLSGPPTERSILQVKLFISHNLSLSPLSCPRVFVSLLLLVVSGGRRNLSIKIKENPDCLILLE